ncbi:MAG TPA: PAS domain-containing protein [Chloroflexota bacterium]|nr:PAS domain-containing protein [Chloroflexota bacterium]
MFIDALRETESDFGPVSLPSTSFSQVSPAAGTAPHAPHAPVAPSAPAADEQLLRALIDILPGAVYRARNAGFPDRLGPWPLVFASPQTADLAGRTSEDLLHDTEGFRRLIHPHDAEAYWSGLEECLVAGTPFRASFRLVHPDGSERWVWEESRGVYDTDGHILGIQGFLADVTERRKTEAERSGEARMAGVRVAARTFEHELRNVLAVTCGYAEMLAGDGTLPEAQRRRASRAAASAHEAAQIIRQLVDVATSEEIDWGAHGHTLRVRG